MYWVNIDWFKIVLWTISYTYITINEESKWELSVEKVDFWGATALPKITFSFYQKKSMIGKFSNLFQSTSEELQYLLPKPSLIGTKSTDKVFLKCPQN